MPANRQQIDLLERVVSGLLRTYSPDTAARWLHGLNPHLGDRRPIDLMRAGCHQQLLDAIAQERAGSFA
jgi:uncharacterized protein (DUF2384 family)